MTKGGPDLCGKFVGSGRNILFTKSKSQLAHAWRYRNTSFFCKAATTRKDIKLRNFKMIVEIGSKVQRISIFNY